MPNGLPRVISFQIEGYSVTVGLPLAISGGAKMPDDAWLPFSPTEQKVLRLLLDSRPLSREEIASKLDEAADGRLRGVLATLVGRHVLLTTADGYRLNTQPGNLSAIRSFLDSLEPGTDGESRSNGG